MEHKESSDRASRKEKIVSTTRSLSNMHISSNSSRTVLVLPCSESVLADGSARSTLSLFVVSVDGVSVDGVMLSRAFVSSLFIFLFSSFIALRNQCEKKMEQNPLDRFHEIIL